MSDSAYPILDGIDSPQDLVEELVGPGVEYSLAYGIGRKAEIGVRDVLAHFLCDLLGSWGNRCDVVDAAGEPVAWCRC